MKIFGVFQFEEIDEGDAGDVFSGYAYRKETLAAEHAGAVWGGSVRTINVLDELPDFVKDLKKAKEG